MHVSTNYCPNTDCGDPLDFAATRCPGCGEMDVGYPNVRYANDPAEVAALDSKVAAAHARAGKDGSRVKLDQFERAVSISSAVTVMSSVDLLPILDGNKLWVSYYKQARAAGSRQSQANKWDMGRDASDSKVNPQYYQELNYAVLSLTDLGSGWYGGCHITLKSDKIASRASVFWQNPFSFLKKPAVNPEDIVPPGHRASWQRRHKLAVAKLHEKILATTPETEFQDILLSGDPSSPEADFIEVHIFGPVARSAFAGVAVNTSLLTSDTELDWESAKRRLDRAGIPIREFASA